MRYGIRYRQSNLMCFVNGRKYYKIEQWKRWGKTFRGENRRDNEIVLSYQLWKVETFNIFVSFTEHRNKKPLHFLTLLLCSPLHTNCTTKMEFYISTNLFNFLSTIPTNSGTATLNTNVSWRHRYQLLFGYLTVE